MFNRSRWDIVRDIKASTPVNVLTIPEIEKLEHNEIVMVMWPGEIQKSLHVIQKVEHDDRISTYAMPWNYRLERCTFRYEISGFGLHKHIGPDVYDIKVWIPESTEAPPITLPTEEEEPAVFATMLF